MSDVHGAPAPTGQPLGNSTETRDATGEIKNQQTTLTTEAPSTTTSPPQEVKKPDASAVPDRYDFKVPDGQTLDPKIVDTVSPVFKELGLTAEQGQKLFDLHTKLTADAKTAIDQTMVTMRTEWRDTVSKDTSIGDGKGDLNDAAKKDIGNVKTLLGDQWGAFNDAMSLTGAGDNPAVIKALRSLGARLGEGTPVRGAAASPLGQASPSAKPQSAAQRMFPNLPSSNA